MDPVKSLILNTAKRILTSNKTETFAQSRAIEAFPAAAATIASGPFTTAARSPKPATATRKGRA